MGSPERISAYVNAICEQIRWKRARPGIAEEMTNHIADQRDAYRAKGLGDDLATDRALTDTGDAVLIGAQLDRAHRPKPQWGLLIGVAALLAIGLVLQLLFWRFSAVRMNNSIIGSFASTGIGLAVLFAAYFADFSLIGRYPKTVYFSVLLLWGAAYLLSSPVARNPLSLWPPSPINNKPLDLRTLYTHYIALLFPLALSAIIYAMRGKGHRGMLVCGAAFIAQAVFAVHVSIITGFYLVVAAGLLLLGIAVGKRWFGVSRARGILLLLLPAAAAAVLILYLLNNYAWWGFFTMLVYSKEYYWSTTWEMLSKASFWGAGNFQPGYMEQDIILSTAVSKWGWIVFIIVGAALLFLVAKGSHACLKQKRPLNMFVSLSVFVTFALQALGNMAYNLQLLWWFRPYSMPFMSFDSLSTVVNLGLLGIMLSVFRNGHAVGTKTRCAARPQTADPEK